VFRRKERFPALPGVDRYDAVSMVVGLGNPGRRYSRTRHNAGFMAVERLLRECEAVAGGDWPQGSLAFARSGPAGFLIFKPGTFMNESGTAVLPVAGHYGLEAERLVVVHDDIDVPFGEVRTRKGGGTAGHRGVESLVRSLGSGGFARVRIGVGRPPAGTDAADYVLSPFTPGEEEEAAVSAAVAADLALALALEAGRGGG